MIVIPLEKLTQDGFKQPANLATETTGTRRGSIVTVRVTHARLYYDDFAGSNYLQGTFTSGDTSTVQFDNANISFYRFKLFKSYDGTTYTEVPSYGGDNGTDEPVSGGLLDPADFADNSIIKKTTINNVEQFVETTLQDLIDDEGIVITGGLPTIVYSVTGSGSNLVATELFNNVSGSPALTSGTVQPLNGVGDFAFIFTTEFLANKTVSKWCQPLTQLMSSDVGDDLPINGYMYCVGKIADDRILLRTVNTSGVDSGGLIDQFQTLHIVFNILDD